MRHAFRGVLLAALALASVSTALSQEYTLKLNVKEGDIFKYRVSLEMNFGEQSVLVTTTITNKVLKVEENGNVQMESSSSELVTKFGDMEMPQPGQPPTKITYKPNYSPAKTDGGDGSMPMNPIPVVYPDKPVKVGDKWSNTIKGSTGEIKFDYELVGAEKLNETEAVKIKVTARLPNSDEASDRNAEGFGWVDPKTGMLLKLEARLKGMQFEGAPMPIDGVMKMELVK
ncbi:MAG: DUF6263 family protein [Fimbriimonadales bacterium]|nr:DUF6263 family protein [Fimbriimonadales bacterium]